jgi:hypothetical protein
MPRGLEGGVWGLRVFSCRRARRNHDIPASSKESIFGIAMPSSHKESVNQLEFSKVED